VLDEKWRVGVEIIVAVFKSALNDVKRVLEELHQVTVHIDYFAVDDDDDAIDTGTADTLRLMHDKITVSSAGETRHTHSRLTALCQGLPG